MMYNDGFLPGYFNSTYEADKYSFRTTSASQALSLTKFQSVFGDPDNGLQRPLEDTRYGIRAEAASASSKKTAQIRSSLDFSRFRMGPVKTIPTSVSTPKCHS